MALQFLHGMKWTTVNIVTGNRSSIGKISKDDKNEDNICSHLWNLSQYRVCNRNCREDNCSNKLESKAVLDIDISTIPKAGNGCFAKEDIEKDEFICEYTGEVIDEDELSLRVHRNYCMYLSTEADQKVFIDAKRYGNYARFINHNRENPNVRFERWIKGDRYVIAAFANVKIKAGTELFVDYWHSKSMSVEAMTQTLDEMLQDSKWGMPGNTECICMRRSKTKFKYSNKSWYRPRKNCVHCDIHCSEDGISKESRRTDFVCVTCGVAVHPPPTLCWKEHKHLLITRDGGRVECFKGDQTSLLLEKGVFYGAAFQGVEATSKNTFGRPDRRFSRLSSDQVASLSSSGLNQHAVNIEGKKNNLADSGDSLSDDEETVPQKKRRTNKKSK